MKEELSGVKHTHEFADLGDWSVCDHVCGGGSQTKEKPCVPPVGGFKCERNIKLKKACNTQPCKAGENPGKIPVPEDEEWKTKQPTITLPIKLDTRYISHRFQQ